MKHMYKLLTLTTFALLLGAGSLLAQTTTPERVMIRDLNDYTGITLESQDDITAQRYNDGTVVVFDAVVMSYPRNSGLASPNAQTGVPGRIHVFVLDVNAATEGREGMGMQIVVDGARQTTLESLFPGDVIEVTGNLTFFTSGTNRTGQFNATGVTQLGNVFEDSQYADLEDLLAPMVVSLSDINIPSPVVPGTHRWNAENYPNIVNQYVKIEGLEVIGRTEANTGRPWMALSDGTSIIYTNDTSLRFRNDRGNNYGGTERNYNYRRLAAELDGPFVPPPTGAIVDISGYIVQNPFNPAGLDETDLQSTLKIAYWDDGVVWTQSGTDTEFRFTEGINNDLVVLGFAPLVDNLELTPSTGIENDTEVALSVDVILPEDDYTLESVRISYTAVGFNEDDADPVVADMTSAGGNSYTFTFPAFDDFTTVSFNISAVSNTPDGVATTGRASGEFYVENAAITSPPQFSQPAGLYANQVSVTLTSQTTGATIYYTTDGSTPTSDSEIFDGSPLVFDQTTTLRAFASASGLADSPVASRVYEIEVDAIEIDNLAELRTSPQTADIYRYTGEAVVTYARSVRNQKYLMDSTGGILVDDPTVQGSNVIISEYNRGDVMTNLFVTLGNFNSQVQAAPFADPGPPSGTATVTPVEVTLDELNLDHESSLILIRDVVFLNPGGTFAGNTNYSIVNSDPEARQDTIIFRTSFSESNYLNTTVPEAAFNLTALVNRFGTTPQLTARDLEDFDMTVSVDRSEMASEFRLNQNFPNPFNPTTNITYSIAESANVNLVVYDILGRRIATLVNEVQSPGQYQVNFDATRLASGTYIYRLEAGGQVSIKKMMLLK